RRVPRVQRQSALRGGVRDPADSDHARLPRGRALVGRARGAVVVYISRTARYVLGAFTTLVLVVLYFPILYIARLSINKARSYAWPPQGFTLEWWRAATHASGPRDALFRSLETALLASAVAVVLGTLASFALTRYRFFGRNAVSFIAVLPIALPGIVTGIALNSGYHRAGIQLSLFTLVVAHATFC